MNTTINAAKEATQDAVKEARGSVMEVVKNVVEVVAFLRRLGVDDALGAVGLARRPSALAGAGMFTSGLIVGAGLGMFFAPMSGRETRTFLMGRIRAAEPFVEETAKKAENAAKEAEKVITYENGRIQSAASKVKSGAENVSS
jgi:gas vesicle protein